MNTYTIYYYCPAKAKNMDSMEVDAYSIFDVIEKFGYSYPDSNIVAVILNEIIL